MWEGDGRFVKATKRLCGVFEAYQVQNKDQTVEEEVENDSPVRGSVLLDPIGDGMGHLDGG